MKNNIFFLLLSGLFLLAGCAKEYSVETGGKGRTLGNWEFKDSTNEYMGTIDTAFIVAAGITNQLTFGGKSLNKRENFSMSIFADTFKVGTYSAILHETIFDYDDEGVSVYKVNQLTGGFTVKITSVTGDVFTGTFSGKGQDSTGAMKDLYDGKFKFHFENASQPVSSGILGGVSGVCQPVTLNGDFVKGIAMTAGNTAELEVTVTEPGTYNIFSETVDGITFSGTGNFTVAGTQKVVLTASGTATSSGDKKFPVHYGNSQCEFSVSFQETATTYDYFPLTVNSQWRYGTDTDSILFEVISEKKTIETQQFSQITANGFYPQTTDKDTILVRKESGNYSSFATYLFTEDFEEATLNEVIILKDNVPAGTTWTANALTATVEGTPVKIDIKFTILEKSVPESIGAFDFLDVIKVKEEIITNGIPAGTREVWYARNVGIVYMESPEGIYEIGDFRIF